MFIEDKQLVEEISRKIAKEEIKLAFGDATPLAKQLAKDAAAAIVAEAKAAADQARAEVKAAAEEAKAAAKEAKEAAKHK